MNHRANLRTYLDLVHRRNWTLVEEPLQRNNGTAAKKYSPFISSDHCLE